jgi:hypothetical protein
MAMYSRWVLLKIECRGHRYGVPFLDRNVVAFATYTHLTNGRPIPILLSIASVSCC